ncbi:hypothetical protein Rhe02_89120 [Rhizocola hellebori]|uniref:OmdA domain containing protein n=1 Tax=Rhizocola hellebori TaxID=1392758 RepID=A0A8J3QH85_9ACTN|nr:YdeI/OmpD-associated family protein [Rhizocola hellebori]GIH10845.1 hypothetical protein Rhe02_89120 [Rhizocola hellebori]
MVEPLRFEHVDQWDRWLAEHHRDPEGAWVLIGKKGTKKPSITLAEAAEVALCYGWIDSIRKSVDGDFFVQKYSPRRPKGSWSQVNVQRAEALMAAGRMRPPGLAEVDAAKADGRWAAAYEPQRNATVPPDLAAALAANKPARESFERLGKTDRYLVTLPLLKAHTPQLRSARLRKIIDDLAAGKE